LLRSFELATASSNERVYHLTASCKRSSEAETFHIGQGCPAWTR